MSAAAHGGEPVTAGPNRWDGEWAISHTRNPRSVQDAAAAGYRFRLSADGAIRWEIPAMSEVVEGRVDGRPMAVRRPGVTGQTLAVTADGPFVLRYTVTFDGIARGEGRMTLIENGTAWVDISQPVGRPELAHVVIYVRPGAADQ